MFHVVKRWYIAADGRQYICFKKGEGKNKTTGETYETQEGKTYHTSLSQCVERIIREEQMKFCANNDMELFEAIKKLEKLETIILKSVNGRTL